MQKAIQIGVDDYIMKTSIDDVLLIDIARRALQETAAEKEAILKPTQSPEVAAPSRDAELIKAINGRQFDIKALDSLAIVSNISSKIAVLIALGKRLTNFAEEKYINFASGVIQLSNSFIREYGSGCALEYKKNRFCIIFSVDEDLYGKKGDAVIDEFCGRLAASVSSYFNIDLSIGVGLAGSFLHLDRAAKKAKEVLKNRFFSRGGGCYTRSLKPNELSLFQYQKNFEGHLTSLEFDSAIKTLDDVVIQIVENPTAKIVQVFDAFCYFAFQIRANIEDKLGDSRPELKNIDLSCSRLRKCEDIYEILEHLTNALCRIAVEIKGDRQSYHTRIIQKSKEYIQKHLGDELSLESVALQANLSATYFSKVFKNIAGINFIKYVIERRIEKAKSLLNEGQKIFVVSESVGYNNQNYFSKLFKNVTGMTPGNYRKSHVVKTDG
jgi:two-component system response regulator YesN